MAAEALHRWSHEFADGRWVATGGGGYAIVDVVPRIWTLLMAELGGASDRPRARPVPEEWRTLRGASALGRSRPAAHDRRGRADGDRLDVAATTPRTPVDQAILATRRAVFPHHGLDPDRD